MMLRTCGSTCTPRWTACATMRVAMVADTRSTPATVRAAASSSPARGGFQAAGRVAQLHGEGHGAAVDAQVAQRARGNEILARVRIAYARERRE